MIVILRVDYTALMMFACLISNRNEAGRKSYWSTIVIVPLILIDFFKWKNHYSLFYCTHYIISVKIFAVQNYQRHRADHIFYI